MVTRNAALWLLVVLILFGCATARQPPVSLAEGYFSTRADRIGVAMSEIPKPATSFPGADCLLCIALASMANSSMTSAVQGWSTDDLKLLKAELVEALKSRGQAAVAIDEVLKMDAIPDRSGANPGFARKDFSAWKASGGVERLLVVHLRALGAWRNYSAYVPTGAPRAVFQGEAYIVDLASHKLDWYETFDLARTAEGNWDEPPNFPGLTNAYYQVVEEGKDAIKRAFVK